MNTPERHIPKGVSQVKHPLILSLKAIQNVKVFPT